MQHFILRNFKYKEEDLTGYRQVQVEHCSRANICINTLSIHYIQMEQNYGKNAYWTSFLCVQMGTYLIFCSYFSFVKKFYFKSIQYGNWLCHLVWWLNKIFWTPT